MESQVKTFFIVHLFITFLTLHPGTQAAAKIVFQWRPTFTQMGEVPASIADGGTIALVDINQDGLLDFVESGRSFGVIYVRIAQKNGTFDNARSIGLKVSSLQAISWRVADLDKNGSLDFVLGQELGGIQICLDPLEGKVCQLISTSPVADLETGDVDGDGWIDVVLTGTKTVIYWGQKNITTTGPIRLSSELGTNLHGKHIQIAPLEKPQNLLPSIIVGGESIVVFLSRGEKRFNRIDLPSNGKTSITALHVADTNGDERLDIVTGGDQNQNQIYFNHRTGDSILDSKSRQALSYGLSPTRQILVEDLNLDRFPDILMVTETGVSLIVGEGTGDFGEGFEVTQTKLQPSSITMTPDPEGLGDRDLFVLTKSGVIIRYSISLKK